MRLHDAKRALLALTPQLDALPRDRLVGIRIDVQIAAAIAHSIAARDGQPERRERIAQIAEITKISPDIVERVAQYALATWYARQQQKLAVATSSDAIVPPEVVRDAQAVRARMLRVATYYLEEHPRHGPLVAAIRSGAGLQDLANDLEELADLYHHPDVSTLIAKDPMYYRPDDPERARAFARTVFEGLGLLGESEAARATDLTQRAWTLLFRAYEELRALGQFAFRNEEDTQLTYPSLIAAARAPRSSRSSPSDLEPGAPEPEDPSDEIPPTEPAPPVAPPAEPSV